MSTHLIRLGQVQDPERPENDDGQGFDARGLGTAIRRVTPTLLVVGIATGLAFAIGGTLGTMLVERLRGPRDRRRR